LSNEESFNVNNYKELFDNIMNLTSGDLSSVKTDQNLGAEVN
jgi:hypothetical protein